MNKLNFNSQVCTTKEQSQRLLVLGLKPETADMSLTVVCGSEIAQWVGKLNNFGNIEVNGIGVPNGEVENIPAWSLHRLIELYSDVEDTSYWCIKSVSYKLLICCIEKAIRCGFLNKEYLK